MRGIDISVYQPNLNFTSIKASGVEVVYMKATEGLTYNNKLLKSQYNGAKSAGLKVGFYHYLRANDPVAEAKHFLSVISGLKSDCLYGIDSEEQTETAGISSRTRRFADYLISQGKPVVLYTGESFYNTEILPIVRDLPLWVAHYGLSKRPTIKSVGWQYNNTPYDLDIFDSGILLTGVTPITSKVATVVKATTTAFKGRPIIKALQQQLNLQCNAKLICDGLVGALTLSACPTVRQGAKGEITRIIQTLLMINKDGIFGADTLKAVKYFQNFNKLVADGIVGQRTWKLLLK